MFNELPLLHVLMTAFFVYAVNSTFEFALKGIILVTVEHDRAGSLSRARVNRTKLLVQNYSRARK